MATEFAVDLVFKSKGLDELGQFNKRVQRLEAASKKAQGGLDSAANQIVRTGRAADKASGSVGGLAGAFGKLAASIGAAALAQKAFSSGVNRIESERRIRLVSKAYGENALLASAASDAAKKFGISQTEANQALADTYARLRPLGQSLSDIESIYGGFNTAAKLSGVSAIESAGA